MSNMAMSDWFRLKRTIPNAGEHKGVVTEEAVLAPIQLDHERMDRALAGPRYALPNGARSPSDIISYLDALAKDLR